MTDKETSKTEKQVEAKKPAELKDEQLDEVQGGGATGRRTHKLLIIKKRIDGLTPL